VKEKHERENICNKDELKRKIKEKTYIIKELRTQRK
jgi:hypothetical protein